MLEPSAANSASSETVKSRAVKSVRVTVLTYLPRSKSSPYNRARSTASNNASLSAIRSDAPDTNSHTFLPNTTAPPLAFANARSSA